MDIQYLLFLQELRASLGPLSDRFFLFITTFGEGLIPYLLGMWFYWAIDKNLGKRLLFGVSYGTILSGTIKMTACVYRPWVRDAAIMPLGDFQRTAAGYSFPSGHTANATASFGGLGWHYRKKKGLCAFFAGVVLLVMFSRNYLGVHTPQDVVVGFLSTVVMMALLYVVLDWAEAGKNRDLLLALGALMLAGISMFYLLHKSYPMDYVDGRLLVDPVPMLADNFTVAGMLVGVTLGWVAERRLVRFRTDVSMAVRIARFVSGVFMFILFLGVGSTVLKTLLGDLAGSFLSACLSLFYCMAIHPFLFSQVERYKR